jgi:hypothetical protein
MEKRRLQFILLLVVGAVVWSAFAWGYMPGVVERAYRGESISYFNNLLDYRHVNPLEFYMAKWYRLAGGLLALWLGAGVLLLATTTQRFARFIGSATPGTLGAMRVLVCLILIYSVWDAKTRTVASLLESQRRSMGVMDWIYAAPFGFDQLVRSDTGLVIFKGATILALALAAIGWKTRLLVPIAALLYLAHGGIIRTTGSSITASFPGTCWRRCASCAAATASRSIAFCASAAARPSRPPMSPSPTTHGAVTSAGSS